MSKKNAPIHSEPLILEIREDTWDDNILQCYKDPGSCCLGCWCGPILLANLYDKIILKGIFVHIMLIFVLLYIYSIKETSEDRMDEDGNYDNSITSTITPVIFFFYVYYLRRMYRAKNSIGEQYCKGCEDTLCALCCPQCVLCQIYRHYVKRQQFGETIDLSRTSIV